MKAFEVSMFPVRGSSFLQSFLHPRTSSSGFTLIELALVIGLISILSMMTLPAFRYFEDSANRSLAHDYFRRLKQASAMYFATSSQVPKTFTEFVTPDPENIGKPNGLVNRGVFEISVPKRKSKTQSACTITANELTCAFSSKLQVYTYTLLANGVVSMSPAQ
jgi:prepilin-type N-terminal cleavage/methylation domain-containing protein